MSLRTFTTASASASASSSSASEEWTRVSHAKVPRTNPFARQQRPAFVEPIVSSAPRNRDHGEKKPKQFSFAAAARLDDATAYVPPSKRAGATESVAPASAKSYDEAFPMLGGAAVPGARATAAALAPGAKSFATLVRERAEKDAVEEEARKLADLRAAAERTEWERERALYRNVGRAAGGGGYNPSNYGYGGAGDDVGEDGYDDHDSLDYDVYGQRVTSYNPSNYGGHTEDDHVDDGNGYYGTNDDGNDDGY